MTEATSGAGPGDLAPARTGFLLPTFLRDLADLNAQYLALGLTPGLEGDPRFGWSEPVRRCLLAADEATRGRIAAVPFSLFDLVLPVGGPAATARRVEDGPVVSIAPQWQVRFESFAHQAVFFARRLGDGEPLAARLVLGLSEEAIQWLAECRLAQLAEVAGAARLVRPRWHQHERFWEVLAAAARRSTPGALQWAHCIGLCLLGADGVATAPPRRRLQR